MAQARGSWSAVLLVLAGATLFGTLGPLSRLAYDAGLSPFAWVAWRAAVGSIGLWAVIATRRGARSVLDGLRAAPLQTRRWLGLAIVAGAALNLSIFVAFQRTAIALALLVFYTYPVMVAVASGLLGHERLDRTRVAALGLAILGMVGVVAGGLEPATGIAVDALGIGLALVAAACQTTFVVASRGYGSVRTEEAMGSILVGSAVIALVAAAVFDGPAALARPLGDPGLLVLLVAVGLFAAALPSFLFLTGIRRLGPVRAGILMLFEPVVGVVLAALLLGEGLTPIQVLGGATILLAAVLVQSQAAGSVSGVRAMMRPSSRRPEARSVAGAHNAAAPTGPAPTWSADGPAEAPAIVFVHGAVISGMWGPQVARLRDRYRCITVDLPGHGRLATQPFTLDAAVESVRMAIDAEAGGRAVLVGLSLGGYVSMAVAASYPDRVRGLVVADASLEPVGVAGAAVLAYGWLLRWLPRNLTREVNVGLFRRAYGRALAIELSAGYDSHAGGHAVVQIRGGRFRDRIRAYGGPVLVLNGDRDRVFTAGERRFVAGLPNVTVRRLAGARHLSNLDRPDDFADAVASFAAGLAS